MGQIPQTRTGVDLDWTGDLVTIYMSQNDLNNHIWHIHLRTTVCPNKFVNRGSHAWAQPNWNAAVESWGAAEAAAAAALFKSNPHPPRCHGRPLSFPPPLVCVCQAPCICPKHYPLFGHQHQHRRHALLFHLRPVQIPETVVVVVRQLYHPFTNGQST